MRVCVYFNLICLFVYLFFFVNIRVVTVEI